MAKLTEAQIARLHQKFAEPNHLPTWELKRMLPEGMTLRLNVSGEYRVNFVGGSEATAYYTNDGQDALDTARAMMTHKLLGEVN